MAVVEGLNTIELRDFRGGLNTQLKAYLIGENQVADVENLLFTDLGARLRKGTSKYNASAVAAAAIRGGFEYRALDGNIWDLLACSNQLYASPNSGTFSSLALSGWLAGASNPAFFDQYMDTVYACNGYNGVLRIRQRYTGSANTLMVTELLPLFPPAAAPSAINYALMMDHFEALTNANWDDGETPSSNERDWTIGDGTNWNPTAVTTAQDRACPASAGAFKIAATASHDTSDYISRRIGYRGGAQFQGAGSMVATFTLNSRTVTGNANCKFNNIMNVNVGDAIGAGDSPTVWYRIALINSATQIILDRPYAEPTATDSDFVIAKDLSRSDALFIWVKADTTGELVNFGFGESAYTDNEFPLEIREANRWELKKIDLTAIASTSRDVVQHIGFRPNRATGAAYNLWIDHLFDPGGLTVPGAYRYKLIYEDSTNQKFSNPSDQSGEVLTNTEDEAATTNRHAMNYVTIAGTSQAGVDLIRIYRTGGLLTDWYYCDTLPAPAQGSTYYYVDNQPDQTRAVLMPHYKGMPAYAEYCQEYNGNMFYAGGYDEGDFNINVTGATVNATASPTCMTAPVVEGVSWGAAVYVESVGSGATMTVALQKYISAAWVTQRSWVKTSAQLTATAWNLFAWGTTVLGDSYVTADTSLWRIIVTSTGGTTPTLRTSDGTALSYKHLVDYGRRLFISNKWEPEILPVQDLADPSRTGTTGGWIDFPHEIMGLKRWLGRLLIFTRGNAGGGVYEFTGQNADEWTWPQISQAGCDASRSITAAGENGVYWYGKGRIWRYDGSSVVDISDDIQQTLQDAVAYEANIAGGYDPDERLVEFAYTASGTTNNAELVLDLELTEETGRPSWTKFTGRAVAVYWEKSGDLYGGEPADGIAWHLNTGTGDNAGTIAYVLEPRHFDVSLGMREGRLRVVDLHADATSAAHTMTLTVKSELTALSRTYTAALNGTGLKKPRFELAREATGRYLGVRLTGAIIERIRLHGVGLRTHNFR